MQIPRYQMYEVLGRAQLLRARHVIYNGANTSISAETLLSTTRNTLLAAVQLSASCKESVFLKKFYS